MLVYWETEAYSEYRESLEYSLRGTHNSLYFCHLELGTYSELCQISIMENFIQNNV